MFPCRVPTCCAVVKAPGAACAVHREWAKGPATAHCVDCNKPIDHDEWYRFDADKDGPLHARCHEKRTQVRTRRPRKSWDKGLALFAQE